MERDSSILVILCTRPRRRRICPLKFAFGPFGLELYSLCAVRNGAPGKRGSAPESSTSTHGAPMGTPLYGSMPLTPSSIT